MGAKDLFHYAVRNALEKEDWIITDDPLIIRFGGVKQEIDLGAEKVIGAMKEDRKIAVEIKSFRSSSHLYDFHLALGQFMNYRMALRREEPDRILYLAVPYEVYESFFLLPFGQASIQEHQLKLVVYEPDWEVITTWLE